ncbi:hypothetical protein GH714_010068 [Hevea brasiliensis]|uniref:CDP-diacylglycerol--inositol 3-phosphatidyltransferase n=1 Tax=Hevea brasiliensis TaxID=3981 RepID=A0A6A6NA54_HEVBR|nr:hypothetical protein GH714_010068 [Hevea brasiliensis]
MNLTVTAVVFFIEALTANKSRSKPSKLDVYLYIPNIVGYTRVFMNCFAFAICFSNKRLFCLLYFISFVCDGIDGWCARKFNQVSTFGAVLDMDQHCLSTSTAFPSIQTWLGFCVIACPRYCKRLAADVQANPVTKMWKAALISFSWLIMETGCSWLTAVQHVLYIILFLIAEKEIENLMDVFIKSMKECSLISFLLGLSLFGWAIKQIVNIIQMKTAADICVLYDIDEKEKA